MPFWAPRAGLSRCCGVLSLLIIFVGFALNVSLFKIVNDMKCFLSCHLVGGGSLVNIKLLDVFDVEPYIGE